jgi:rare lipoprotein A
VRRLALILGAPVLLLAGAGCGRVALDTWMPDEAETGVASYYASKFEGRKTASGERYDAGEMTAAHPSLPFGTRVRVTNLENEKSVEVRINDRGPFRKGRVIDLSHRAAEKLGIVRRGLARVAVAVIELP